MADIFILYEREDLQVALEIATGLKNAGYSTWYYEEDSIPGCDYDPQIIEQIKDCKVIIPLISNDFVESPKKIEEMELAHREGKKIIPILVNLKYIGLEKRAPALYQIIKSIAAMGASPQDITGKIPRIIKGLEHLGIQPEREPIKVANHAKAQMQDERSIDEDKPCDIFTIYAEEDGKLVRDIAKGLENVGYSTLYYERDAIPGDDHFEWSGREIKRCQAVIFIISCSSIKSYQVEFEIQWAGQLGKHIIPLLVDISYEELVEEKPNFGVILGSRSCMPIREEEVSTLIPRIVKGAPTKGDPPRTRRGSTG
jgi:hypothetical protein